MKITPLSGQHYSVFTTLHQQSEKLFKLGESSQYLRPIEKVLWPRSVFSVLTLAAVRDEVDGWDGHDDDAHNEVRHGQAHDEHVGHCLQSLLCSGGKHWSFSEEFLNKSHFWELKCLKVILKVLKLEANIDNFLRNYLMKVIYKIYTLK